mmetsp:Transcript_3876/g.13698  ORF Transcript_3876/g.13698 Transcript_3876/m.13698 type:complete len:303 (-) Transcript_3876:418-1326(-)
MSPSCCLAACFMRATSTPCSSSSISMRVFSCLLTSANHCSSGFTASFSIDRALPRKDWNSACSGCTCASGTATASCGHCVPTATNTVPSWTRSTRTNIAAATGARPGGPELSEPLVSPQSDPWSPPLSSSAPESAREGEGQRGMALSEFSGSALALSSAAAGEEGRRMRSSSSEGLLFDRLCDPSAATALGSRMEVVLPARLPPASSPRWRRRMSMEARQEFFSFFPVRFRSRTPSAGCGGGASSKAALRVFRFLPFASVLIAVGAAMFPALSSAGKRIASEPLTTCRLVEDRRVPADDSLS